MKYPTRHIILLLHKRLIEKTGGSHGLRDSAFLDSALDQPRMTFAGQERYPELAEPLAGG